MRHKITFNLESPIITYEPIMFDSLLLYCYLEDTIGAVPQWLNIKDDIDLPDGLLNKHESGAWLASQMMTNDDPLLDLSFFTKHWETAFQHLVENKKQKILTSKGPYKSYNIPYETKSYESVFFVIDTDNIAEVARLIRNQCFSLGKKRNRGYGKVRNIEITQTDMKITRPIPTTEKTGIIYMRTKPPYWSYEDIVRCKVEQI